MHATLSTVEIASVIAANINTIELAVLSIIENQPSHIFAMLEDLISGATIEAMRKLRRFQRRYAQPEAISAWIRKAARWFTMNAIRRTSMVERVTPSRGSMLSVAAEGVAQDDRREDAARLAAALDTLAADTRTVFVRLMDGERAIDVAKTMGMSAPTVTRRKQEAIKVVTRALKRAA